MEYYYLAHDIQVMYYTATSFPAGVLAAHQKIHDLFPAGDQRWFFGVSRPEGGKEIIYHAGAEELKPGEAANLGLSTLNLKAGTYASAIIRNFMENIPAISATFQQLLDRQDIDSTGYCVELYLGPNLPESVYKSAGITDKDVRCMVRINN